MIVADNKSTMTQDNSQEVSTPTLYRIDLKSIDDVRLEMAKVYRSMKSGEIPSSDGTRFVYVLSQIGKLIEVYEVEKRLSILEGFKK